MYATKSQTQSRENTSQEKCIKNKKKQKTKKSPKDGLRVRTKNIFLKIGKNLSVKNTHQELNTKNE